MPAEPSSAWKKNLQPARFLATYSGDDERVPARMSLTRTVPAAVPSELHSSMPVAGVVVVGLEVRLH